MATSEGKPSDEKQIIFPEHSNQITKLLHTLVPINFAVWGILIILFWKPQQRLYLKNKFSKKNNLKSFIFKHLADSKVVFLNQNQIIFQMLFTD